MSVIDAIANSSSDLIMDKSYVFHRAGEQFASHQTVYPFAKEYARGDIHINMAESFGAMLERIKTGIFHHMSSLTLLPVSTTLQHPLPIRQ